MKWKSTIPQITHRLIFQILIMVLFLCFIASTSLSANSPKEMLDPPGKLNLDLLLNYPFQNCSDLDLIYHQSKSLLAAGAKSNMDQGTFNVLTEISAFTATQLVADEELSIISFSKSNNQALKRLRTEIGLPSPPGGAIVRVYRSREVIPLPIRRLFESRIQGFTYQYRFIAINAENKSPEELAAITTHELVHAYIFSYLGPGRTYLPKWFNEGVALYLSGAKDQYTTQLGPGFILTTRPPQDYEEYFLCFRYLDDALGRLKIARFIRRVVQEQSAEGVLSEMTGLRDFNELLAQARRWQLWEQEKTFLIFLSFLALLFGVFFWSKYRNRIRTLPLAQIQLEKAQALIQFYDQRIMAQTGESGIPAENITSAQALIQSNTERKARAMAIKARILVKVGQHDEAEGLLVEAIQTAGWSQRVQDAVQRVRNELNGIRV